MDKELSRLLENHKSAFEQDQKNEISKLAVQSYLDNTIWKLFSRTELQNKKLLFNNDQNRLNDKKCLQRLIYTLFEYNSRETEALFLDQLHEWIVHITTIYLNIASPTDKKRLLSNFINTANISPWAIPLIQYKINTRSEIEDYLDTIQIFFEHYNDKWTEDDYLMVLDQLATEYNYNKIIEILADDELPDLTIQYTRTLIYILLNCTIAAADTTLLKRVSQAIIQIITLFVEATREKGWDCQVQIDDLLCHLVFKFNDLHQWFLLLNIPYSFLSKEALWHIIAHLLKLRDEPPASLNDVIHENLPNIARFQYDLHAHQAQGYFMLTSLVNIAICIPQGVDEISNTHQDSILSTCIITVICYTLFTVAFIDKELRELFYKDVRTHLSTICSHHPFIISLVFRWTAEHLSIMERMSLYVFRNISLTHWNILHDDLQLIHKLLLSSKKEGVQLAQYILSHLNYEYSIDTVDRSHPWHPRKAPFLPYTIHEEIGFILVDAACQATTNQVVKKGPMNELIEWAWSIVIQLKLYDCPVSPKATDPSLDTTAFLKGLLHSDPPTQTDHHVLLTYVSLMLSPVSRDFLKFETNNGWLKLFVVLKRGGPLLVEAVFRAFSQIVPSFVYMHGDDFFHDTSTLLDFLKYLVDADRVRVSEVIGSHVWQAYLMDSTSEVEGFSYVDLMLHCWLQTVIQTKDWIWQSNYVCLVDTLCRLAFILHRQELVYEVLQYHQQVGKEDASPGITRWLKTKVVTETQAATLIVGEWSMLKPTRGPGVELKYHWFAFHALVVETKLEIIRREEEIRALVEDKSPKKTTTLDSYFTIYRWLQHISVLPVDHALLPLYCQMFFSLYFKRLNDDHTMGSVLFVDKKKRDMIAKLRDHIANAQTFFGQKIGKTQDAEKLQAFYYSAWLWLGDKELQSLKKIGEEEYDTKRLKACYGLESIDSLELWLDLVDMEGLEQEFLNFSWEGSDKFRTGLQEDDEETSSHHPSSSLEDQMSLSTNPSVRRNMKLVTDESTIIPLPSVVINTPTPVRSNSLKY